MKAFFAIAGGLAVLLAPAFESARAAPTPPVLRNHRGKLDQHGAPRGGVRVYRPCRYGTTSACAPRH